MLARPVVLQEAILPVACSGQQRRHRFSIIALQRKQAWTQIEGDR